MRKFIILFTAVLFIVFYSMPAMAFLGGNSNKNTNLNTNTNTQGQGQMQGQGQFQEINIAADPREHLGVVGLDYGKLGVFNESHKYGAEFTTFARLVAFKKVWSYEHALKHYGKSYGKGKCITIGGSYSGRHEGEPSKGVTVIEPKAVNLSTMEPVGFLTVKANPKWHKKWFVKAADKNVDSFTILQKGVLSACIMQGNYIMKVREGATFMSMSSGRGLGFNASGGIINDMDNRGKSASSSAGTGVSSGEAWNKTLPYIIFQVFKDK